MKKSISSKIIILVLFVIAITSGSYLGYAYYDNLNQDTYESVSLGEWWTSGTAISTAQEFYDAVTNLNSTSDDSYYLTQDIDFTNFNWEYTDTIDDVIFRGTLDGNGYSINNLTIYTYSTSHTYFGLFARVEGGTITNLVFNNVQLELSSTVLNYSHMRTGLIAGRVIDGNSTISNITIIDSGVRGTSYYGVGGLVGQVYGTSANLNISNIKTDNLTVYTSTYNVGGLVGYIYSRGSTVNISDVDVDVEVFSEYAYSYQGGLVGKIKAGAYLNINNAIIEMSTKNTSENGLGTLGEYTGKYTAGVIGYNQSYDVTINNTFFTGSLEIYNSKYYTYVATLIGRNIGSYSGSNNYYSYVEFLNSSGNIQYTLSSSRGIMSTMVESNSMPSLTWWNSFFTNFNTTETIWSQDTTGRIYLLR